jgi:ribosome-binding protein aMBF1 (putative translation factor)
MLVQICQVCGSTITTSPLTVTVTEGNFTKHLSVCQQCYTMTINESSKLLHS